jgi:hypothetical protein
VRSKMLMGCFHFVWRKLEHDPEKWVPVFRKRSCSNNNRFAPSGGQMFWCNHGQARPENQIWVETPSSSAQRNSA